MLYLLSNAENLSVPNIRSMPNIIKANSPAVVTCMGLTKIYQTGTVALDNLTLTIEPGMCFGLIGENGAGKSTLVKLLMGFIFPTNGQLSVLGETEVRRAHARIGYLHERPYVELRLTAMLGMLLVAVYIIGLALVAGKWLERRELLLY
jgi:ABC-type Na+ transport system ATPase subunit NatA